MSVRDELLKFHSQWYSSNIMSMAILGQQVSSIYSWGRAVPSSLFRDAESHNMALTALDQQVC